MNTQEIKSMRTEIRYLVNELYGIDMGGFAGNFADRRIELMAVRKGYKNTRQLKDAVINNESFAREIMDTITVNVTQMFRNPEFFKKLTSVIRDEYSERNSIRIWHPGCSNGQEVFSLAILLKEESLLDKCLLYGTEINHTALKIAQKGIVDASMLRHYNDSYRKSGGKFSLREYFNLSYDKALLDRNIRNKIQFGYHQLELDNSFQEFDIVCCRNLFIYYDNTVQTLMLEKMMRSLKPNGILCLGVQESIRHLELADQFETISEDLTIYRKIAA